MSLSISLSKSTDMFELLSAVKQPIYVKNTAHEWLYVNGACAALIGLSPEAIIGRSEIDFLPQQLASQLRRQDDAFLAGSVSSSGAASGAEQAPGRGAAESHALTFNGRQVAGHRQAIAIDGEPALLNTLEDVTALKQASQENEQLAEDLRTKQAELNTALSQEETLKRITDRVRDSLDEEQILQAAVEELVKALHAQEANTALYDLEQGTSTVYYECAPGTNTMRGRVSQMEAYSEVYHQLLAGKYLQFCSISPNPQRGRVSMFAAPILDDRDVLGDLWLINDVDSCLSELDIRLVQQVTNQCAIAIRQARLYQESQSQVRELEHVNTLKDDFLSTVSHELRTPVTSMRVALQLLGVTLTQECGLEESELKKPQSEQGRLARYYCILQEECEREISLINDLLDLQRLDVGNHPMLIQPIDLSNWLPSLVNGFKPRTSSRELSISLNIADGLPELISDLASLDRVLTELINNACKYTPPQHSINIAIVANAHVMQFKVVNTGVEIAEEEQKHIFDKFYRVPSADPWKQGGTGLGLALSQKLVEHLEGVIRVESGEGQTAFSVELPLVHSGAPT
ncbi:MAG: ATP-binding protein [Cyanobacteria bacterium J06626_6]